MKTGSSLFDTSRFTVEKTHQPCRGSERGELLDKFLARLNPPRIAGGYRPYTHSRLSMMIQHLKTDELWPFYRQCEQAGIPFSAFFHWKLEGEAENRYIVGRAEPSKYRAKCQTRRPLSA